MKLYKVQLGGVDHYMRLSDDDARRYNAVEVGSATKAAPTPQNKEADKPQNKSAK